MQVSSESLFHFTNSLKNIESILVKKFHPTYCNEVFQLNEETYNEYVPMVSFCDLPLGLIKIHIEKYGSYGIGMTKEWGIRNHLNPVLYLESHSIISGEFNLAFDSINNLFDISDSLGKVINDEQKIHVEKIDSQIIQSAKINLNLIRFIKNYEGQLNRGEKNFSNYRFYDEREWRYVPAYDSTEVKPSLSKDEYDKYRGLSASKPLIEKISLNFMSNDIKYLIVKTEKEIPKLIRIIKSANNLSENPDESDILTSKILTVEQIKTDF